ncbi:MAG: hypothetical protein DWQ07_19545 [Chloroflexi bacterium]|nr:MAG: hypothetical protein DWQ07_19545 [Chloroflexota bacterium]MBL1194277.1 hypothetical protein [Chloroflexota bacterium]NOH11567.1 hypothetical protein [Chloroflexota bacterium]
MSVKIIENWTALVGRVEGLEVSEVVREFHVATIFVMQADDVDDFPNMLADSVNTNIQCHIPDEVCERLKIASGMQLSARVRHASQNRNFVHTREISVASDEGQEAEGFFQRLIKRLRPDQG